VLVKDIIPGTLGSNPANLTNVNGTLFFTIYDTASGHQLWKSDGSTAGTVMIKNTYAAGNSNVSFNLTNVSGTLFFRADTGSGGLGLWKSDGTAAGTVLLKNADPAYLTSVNGILFFTLGAELWKSNGTAAGTVLVKAIHPGSFASNPPDRGHVLGQCPYTIKVQFPL